MKKQALMLSVAGSLIGFSCTNSKNQRSAPEVPSSVPTSQVLARIDSVDSCNDVLRIDTSRLAILKNVRRKANLQIIGAIKKSAELQYRDGCCPHRGDIIMVDMDPSQRNKISSFKIFSLVHLN